MVHASWHTEKLYRQLYIHVCFLVAAKLLYDLKNGKSPKEPETEKDTNVGNEEEHPKKKLKECLKFILFTMST